MLVAVLAITACSSSPATDLHGNVLPTEPLLTAPVDGSRVVLLGGSYLRSAAPALVAGLATVGVEVLNATETGLQTSYLNPLFYDWQAEFDAYLEVLQPDAAIVSIPLGIEVMEGCMYEAQATTEGQVSAFNRCVDEGMVADAVANVEQVAELLDRHGIRMIFLNDMSAWPGPGGYDGTEPEIERAIFRAMGIEEHAIAAALKSRGMLFFSIRRALTGEQGWHWTQEPDGHWYNWRFPEAGNMHLCQRGAAHLTVRMAPYIAEGAQLSMRDAWVSGPWNADAWYRNAGCAEGPSPHPRYLPQPYDPDQIEVTPSAGVTDEVLDITVPGDPVFCAILDDRLVVNVIERTDIWNSASWGPIVHATPKWHRLPIVMQEKMRWSRGCRFTPTVGGEQMSPDASITAVEWSQTESELDRAFIAAGFEKRTSTADDVAIYASAVGRELYGLPSLTLPTAALVEHDGRSFTVHAPVWPVLTMVEWWLQRDYVDADEEGPLLEWLSEELDEMLVAALVELAMALAPPQG